MRIAQREREKGHTCSKKWWHRLYRNPSITLWRRKRVRAPQRTAYARIKWYTLATIGHGGGVMGSISIACYKPRPGCEEALLELVRNHLPPLRAEGLVTERPSIVMRTADGTIVEIFEWVSQEAIAGAHQNPAVLELWKRFEAVS